MRPHRTHHISLIAKPPGQVLRMRPVQTTGPRSPRAPGSQAVLPHYACPGPQDEASRWATGPRSPRAPGSQAVLPRYACPGPPLLGCAQLCPTVCDPVDCSPPGSSVHGDSPGKSTGVGSLSLLQGNFPTQESNWGLLHYRRVLHQLSYPERGHLLFS